MEENKLDKKRFRIRSKRLFLTYAKVLDIDNVESLFIKSLRKSFGESKMQYLITKENHEDGTPHIHIYLEFESIQHINSREQLAVILVDPISGENVIHVGKYESVKNKHKVIEYLLKTLDIKSGTVSSLNTNMILPLVDGVYYSSPEDHLSTVLHKYGLENALDILLTSYRTLFVRKGKTIVTNLKLMDDLKQRKLNKELTSIRSLDEFNNIPSLVLEWKKLPTTSLILYGPSGTGKTELAKSILDSMGLEVIFCRDRNSLRHESIRSDLTGIIFDDMQINQFTREEMIHMFDVENLSQIRVLYGEVNIPPKVSRIFTTNCLSRIFGYSNILLVPKELTRRVTIVEVSKPLQINYNITVNNNKYENCIINTTKN